MNTLVVTKSLGKAYPLTHAGRIGTRTESKMSGSWAGSYLTGCSQRTLVS